ncbi:MAG: tetratricopeptide repeat protein [archaeon]|nr:tetratricopeptide repeat protein [archaeon]
MNTRMDLLNSSSPNQNISMSIDNIENTQQKIKLDEILDGIKALKVDFTFSDELRAAIKLMRKFKLYESAKWCSELLISLTDPNSQLNSGGNNLYSEGFQGKNLSAIFNKTSLFDSSSNHKSGSNFDNDFGNNQIGTQMNPTSNFCIGNKFTILYQKYKSEEYPIKDVLTYASSLLDLKEFVKCKGILSKYAIPKYPSAMFIYFYCEYMLIQQQMQEGMLEKKDSEQFNYTDPSNLNKLQKDLEKSANEFSPFMSYLYGVILKDLKRFDEAKKYFIICLSQFPFLWSCWVELCKISSITDFKNIFSEIDDHWMKYFYLSNFLNEKNHEQESLTISTSLLNLFPNSLFLLNSLGHSYYFMREYDTAIAYFDKLTQLDPNRYENMDTYSNILFIKENYCELSNLACKCYQIDKYRPETCCVLGNFFALKGDHPKAVTYFKRAIKLDYSFLSAWILMGHEYLEMKLISSAIESYRTAVDIDQTDYRAWYGLGQTYEIHQMFNFALYYFMNAAKANPNDSRMWTASGLCYEKMNKKKEAINCYEKAVYCKDNENIALYRMAKIYLEQGMEDRAAICFRENVSKVPDDEIETPELLESCIFLAKYYKNKGQLDEAYNFLIKLKDYEGSEKDEIHSLMREIMSLKANSQNNQGGSQNI